MNFDDTFKIEKDFAYPGLAEAYEENGSNTSSNDILGK